MSTLHFTATAYDQHGQVIATEPFTTPDTPLGESYLWDGAMLALAAYSPARVMICNDAGSVVDLSDVP